MVEPRKTRRDVTDKTIRKYTEFDEMKADEYRYWQSRPAHEWLDAVEELIELAYQLKKWKIEPDVPRSRMPVERLPCPWLKKKANIFEPTENT